MTQGITTYTEEKTPSHDTKENEKDVQECLFLSWYLSTQAEVHDLTGIND